MYLNEDAPNYKDTIEHMLNDILNKLGAKADRKYKDKLVKDILSKWSKTK